jgi:hypothetical protein
MFLNKVKVVRQSVPVGKSSGFGVKVLPPPRRIPQEMARIIKEEMVS